MSDFLEDNENINLESDTVSQETPPESGAEIGENTVEDDEFSTIFSNPAEKKPPRASNAGKRRIIAIIAAALAVVVLVSGTLTIIKLIPEKQEDEQSEQLPEISVLELDYKLLDRVSITNQNGTFVFTCNRKTTTDESGNETVDIDWVAEGVKDGKLSSDSISNIISRLDSLTALRDITSKSAEQCGLDTPSRRIDVESEKYGSFSVLIGDLSPDNSGVYLKLSTKDNIYLVSSDFAEAFDFDYLDLADAPGFSALEITDAMKDYTDEEGKLASFDSLTVKGENFPSPLVFVPNSNSFVSNFCPFETLSPAKHDADNVTEIMGIFTDGIACDGAYSLEINDDELKKAGLDKPDCIVTISLAGITKTFKFKVIDDNYCAVIDDNSTIIQRVSKDSVPFVNYSAEFFYSNWVYLRSIDDVNLLTFDVGENSYSFQISSEDSDGSKTYNITHNGKQIETEKFQDFYMEFIGLKTSDFNIEATDAAPEMSVTAKFNDGHTDVLTFTRTAATRYQYTINGEASGRITSSAYNKIVNYLKLVSANKSIK